VLFCIGTSLDQEKKRIPCWSRRGDEDDGIEDESQSRKEDERDVRLVVMHQEGRSDRITNDDIHLLLK
jgi:hypothetical protein